MKLVRFGPDGREKPGLIDSGGVLRDLTGLVADIDGAALTPASLSRLAQTDPTRLPVVGGAQRLGACVARPCNFLAVGLNYSDHADEIGLPRPTEPVLFQKASNCICGPDDPTILPREADRLDWEVEVALVIGTRASYVTESAAMDHVAGFCLANDVSERGFQLDRGGTWTKGKSAASFGPLGPWLVTRDEIADPSDIKLWLDVDGQRMQAGTTRNMIFSFAALVAYISRFFVLEAGDVILTGTPAGVGQGMTPKRFLKVGETVTLGAHGLGTQSHIVKTYGPSNDGLRKPAGH
jgi:2-keto-4-pentenoate hydratase/2-oxohepta-3-ene-1,7-dioic acid hydratase in catechol pathway